MAATDTDRQPWPVTGEDVDDACPACGATGQLQLAEETIRYWRGFHRTPEGIFVYDDTTADDGDDTRIECMACLTSWDPPAEIDYG